MDRFLARAFNSAAAQDTLQANENPNIDKRPRRGTQGVPSSNDSPRSESSNTPCYSPPPVPLDGTAAILDAWEKKEYFRMLGLPDPTSDELGRPVWPCTAADVSRAYRRLSVSVHPDKNPGEDARRAFEALNQAHRILKDPGEREAALRAISGRLKAEREKAEAAAGIADRIKGHGERNNKARQLRKDEGNSFQAEIVEQMRKRQAEGQYKVHLKERGNSSSHRARMEEDEGTHIHHTGPDDSSRQGSQQQKQPTNSLPLQQQQHHHQDHKQNQSQQQAQQKPNSNYFDQSSALHIPPRSSQHVQGCPKPVTSFQKDSKDSKSVSVQQSRVESQTSQGQGKGGRGGDESDDDVDTKSAARSSTAARGKRKQSFI